MTQRPAIPLGDAAPDFELRDQHGQRVRLSSYRGRMTVVLMFYPYAFSRVCTRELEEVRDGHPELVSETVQLLAISCDPMFSLREYADRERLVFPLLSDFWPHGEVASAYGVFDSARGCAHRSSYVVDRDGVVRWSVHNATGDARDLDELRQVLAALAGPGR